MTAAPFTAPHLSSPFVPSHIPDLSKGATIEENARTLAALTHHALIREATLTPKPGLVDGRNNGAHSDMTLATFIASADALHPQFGTFVLTGAATANEPASQAFLSLRSHGLVCEQTMLAATDGINTHKGAIFAFGLLLGAAGRCLTMALPLSPELICREVASMVSGLVERELKASSQTARTAGEHIYRRYGLSGARGEAQSGFDSVISRALPTYRSIMQKSGNEETALLAVLLELLANSKDTNLIARGGLDGLFFVRRQARHLKRQGGSNMPAFQDRLMMLDDEMIARNLSPGGCADLLAITWFLARLPATKPDSDR